jgi:hypothetical protein
MRRKESLDYRPVYKDYGRLPYEALDVFQGDNALYEIVAALCRSDTKRTGGAFTKPVELAVLPRFMRCYLETIGNRPMCLDTVCRRFIAGDYYKAHDAVAADVRQVVHNAMRWSTRLRTRWLRDAATLLWAEFDKAYREFQPNLVSPCPVTYEEYVVSIADKSMHCQVDDTRHISREDTQGVHGLTESDSAHGSTGTWTWQVQPQAIVLNALSETNRVKPNDKTLQTFAIRSAWSWHDQSQPVFANSVDTRASSQ